MATVLSGTALAADISTVRERDTDISTFRSAMRRVALQLAVETSRHLPAKETRIETPITETAGTAIDGQVVIVPVLRAGLGLLDAFLEIIPSADVGFIGLARDEEKLTPAEYYRRFPDTDESTTLIIVDPMLATGGSLVATAEALKGLPHANMMVSCLIAAPEGVKNFEDHFPNVRLTVAALDSHLNDVGYIVPGLGDAGDRLFGT